MHRAHIWSYDPIMPQSMVITSAPGRMAGSVFHVVHSTRPNSEPAMLLDSFSLVVNRVVRSSCVTIGFTPHISIAITPRE